jgi:intracellular multiplication protein IcmO
MKVEDPQATADLIIKKGGKGLRAFSAGFDANVGEMGMRYSDRNSAEIKEVDRINFLDLKGQDEGEMHIVWKTRLVRARGFYVNPPAALDKDRLFLEPNQFLKIARPNPEDVSLKQRLPAIAETLSRPDHVERMRRAAEELTGSLEERARSGDEIAVCAMAISAVRTGKNPRDRTEAAAASVAAMLRSQKAKAHEVGGDIRALDSLKAFDNPGAAGAGGGFGMGGGLGGRPPGRPGMQPGAQQRGRGLGVQDPYEQIAGDLGRPDETIREAPRQPQRPLRQQPPVFADAEDVDDGSPMMTAPPPVKRQLPAKADAVPHSIDVDGDSHVDMANDLHKSEIMVRFMSAMDSDGGPEGVKQEMEDAVSSLHGYHPSARTAEAPPREMENARRISDAAAGRGEWPIEEPEPVRERVRELETAGGPPREDRGTPRKPALSIDQASSMASSSTPCSTRRRSEPWPNDASAWHSPVAIPWKGSSRRTASTARRRTSRGRFWTGWRPAESWPHTFRPGRPSTSAAAETAAWRGSSPYGTP